MLPDPNPNHETVDGNDIKNKARLSPSNALHSSYQFTSESVWEREIPWKRKQRETEQRKIEDIGEPIWGRGCSIFKEARGQFMGDWINCIISLGKKILDLRRAWMTVSWQARYKSHESCVRVCERRWLVFISTRAFNGPLSACHSQGGAYSGDPWGEALKNKQPTEGEEEER